MAPIQIALEALFLVHVMTNTMTYLDVLSNHAIRTSMNVLLVNISLQIC